MEWVGVRLSHGHIRHQFVVRINAIDSLMVLLIYVGLRANRTRSYEYVRFVCMMIDMMKLYTAAEL